MTSTTDTDYWREYNGGALLNNGSITSVVADFTNNYLDVNSASTTKAQAYGGAISNRLTTSSIGSITGNFSNNYAKSNNDQAYGGAIYNRGTIGDITSTVGFTGNYAQSTSGNAIGGAIVNLGNSTNIAKINSISGNFENNYAHSENDEADGGAINNNNYSEITNGITGNFTNNRAIGTSAYGGAIFNRGTIGDINSTGGFSGNYVKSENGNALGGAIYNTGTINKINGTFKENHVQSNTLSGGGAIYNTGTIGEIEGLFEGNYAKSLYDASSRIGSRGASIANIGGEITSINADFKNNYIEASGISEISSVAIENAGGTIGSIKSTNGFSGNYLVSDLATNVYASTIFNVGDSADKKSVINSIEANFDSNYTVTKGNVHGGVLANYVYSEITNGIKGDFTNNYAITTGDSLCRAWTYI